MKNEFVPYDMALAMKELGFDEKVFGHYIYRELRLLIINGYKEGIELLAPTYSQAFRWFREKYKLMSYVHSVTLSSTRDNKDEWIWKNWIFHISNPKGGWASQKKDERIYFHLDSRDGFDTYGEAQDACLKKLIEIVKEKL